ncbi:MAG: hypothetical protein ACLQAH_06120 [Limisphaerales bacterium]
MNRRWLSWVSVFLVAFTGLVIAWQFLHRSEKRGNVALSAFAQSALRSEQMAKVTDILRRETSQASALDRRIDLMLPDNARLFMIDMTGPTNYFRVGYYYYLTYYLFPREIDVSVDQPTRITKDGFPGQTIESDEEVFSRGYTLKVYAKSEDHLICTAPLGFQPREVRNPDWFNSDSDTIVAFLLPLLTALAGMWLFRFLFPGSSGRTPLLEQLAYGLGLGMMAVAALTLGVKLCGFHGYRLVFLTAAAGGVAEIWRDRKAFWAETTADCRQLAHRPIALAIGAIGLVVFLILFRLAGLQGLIEFDALMAWSLKAKILHLYAGHDLVQWFSSPRLTGAHLDYPTLVPSLHAATYDSIGHVDEFVTKFWPTWMLFLLLGALASLNQGLKSRFQAPQVALLGLLLLPATQKYVQMEGGTLPMVFFTVLGFVQCALWLVEKDPARLGLGLTLLFGAAMSKFEGFIFLALAGSWMLLLPSARPSLKPSPRHWRLLAFCLLAALPFVCLRVSIPALNFESGWAGYALSHPATTLSNWPGIFMILLARLFVNPDLASWDGENGSLHWTGKWDGLVSLYNQSTLGLAWLCLFLTVVLWLAVPARRKSVVWLLAMLVGATAAFSGVFACFVSITSLTHVMGYTADDVAGRYLLPVLLAWFATVLTLFFMSLPAARSAAATGTTATVPKKSRQRQGAAKTRPASGA